MQARPMNALEWTLVVTLSVIWGGSFFFTEVALQVFGPLTIVLGRVGIAALALWCFVLFRGYPVPRDPRIWLAFLVMGALNNVTPFGLISWGQQFIDSGTASILNATTPLFSVFLAHVLTSDEKLTVNRVVGIVLGMVGVAVLVGPQALSGFGAADWGQVAVLGAALSYAFAGIYGRRLRGLPTAVAAAGMLTGSTVLVLPIAVYFEGAGLSAPWTAVHAASILGIALLCTSVAYLLYFRILATAGATNLLLVTLMIPPSATALGVLFLDERLSPAAIAGMALIGAGLLAVDGRALRFLYRPSTSSGG